VKGSKKIVYKNGTEAFWTGTLCDLDPVNSCGPVNPCQGFPNTDYLKLYGSTPYGTCEDLLDG